MVGGSKEKQTNAEKGGRGSKIPEILRTSFMYGPLAQNVEHIFTILTALSSIKITDYYMSLLTREMKRCGGPLVRAGANLSATSRKWGHCTR